VVNTENWDLLLNQGFVEDQNFSNDAYKNWNFEEYKKDILDQLGRYQNGGFPLERKPLFRVPIHPRLLRATP